MRVVITVLLLLATIHMQAQSFKKFTDEDTQDLIYQGQITFTDLQKEKAFDWYDQGAAAYNPDRETIAQLKPLLKSYTLVVFLGTWCSDSHKLVPELVKVLQLSDYPLNKVKVFSLDHSKTGLNGEEKKYNISYLPTIIVYKDGKEEGRVIETVEESIESDLLSIVRGETDDNSLTDDE